MARIAGLMLVLAACGVRIDVELADASLGGGVDGPVAADAAPDAVSAMADNACGVAADQGDIGAVAATGEASTQGEGALTYRLLAPTPATVMAATPDVIYVELWDNYGVFQNGGARPGTFAITGDELAYATCGVCVFTLADVTADGAPTRYLLATSGTVIIHAVAPTAGSPLEIELQDVVFQEVDQSYQPVPGSSCPSPLAHGRLDGTLDLTQ